MRVLLQTVKEAKVTILGKTVGQIKQGFLLLVGFTDGDTKETVDFIVQKIVALRAFADENRQINLSLEDVNGSILSVSQFTLYADTSHGRRPSFIKAMKPFEAEKFYDYFNNQLEYKSGKNVATGVFGADMLVESCNDGPFTLILDSEELIK